jgi:hypothetical protein
MAKYRVQILAHVYVDADSEREAERLALQQGKELMQFKDATVTAAQHAERIQA